MEKKNEDVKTSYTIEEVVDIIGDKFTFKMLLVVLSLMAFNSAASLHAYFPSFGGFIPYDKWRCFSNSTACLNIQPPLKQLYKTSMAPTTSETYLDYGCKLQIQLVNLELDSAKIYLLSEDRQIISTILFDLINNNIIIYADSNCNPGDTICSINIKVDPDVNKRIDECEFETSILDRPASLECTGSTEFNKSLATATWLHGSGNSVRFFTLENINKYQLICPDPTKYNQSLLCSPETPLTAGLDFTWITNGRESFSLEWHLYCGREYLLTMIGSVYFGGALIGTSVGGTLYDVIGRKKGSVIGYLLLIVATFAAAFSPSLEFMFVCRFFQGLGTFVGFTGMFVLLLEYSAAKNRNYFNTGILFAWAIGYCISTGVSYLIYSWHWLATVPGFIICSLMIPLLLTPESPRYLLSIKLDEAAAKRSLKWLARKHNNTDIDIDAVQIREVVVKDEDKEPSFRDSFRDFINYPELAIQMVLQMIAWTFAGFLYYGFSFSWSKLGDDLYISYLFAALGEILAYILMTFALKYIGRKISLIVCYIGGGVFFLLAMIRVPIGILTVEQLSCLLGSMLVAAAFGSIYLYTIELTPTVHRGKILGYCSFSARIGSFCGPQASLLLGWNRYVTLVIFAVLSCVGGLCLLRLPRTNNIPIPTTAAEVQERRNNRIHPLCTKNAIENPAHEP